MDTDDKIIVSWVPRRRCSGAAPRRQRFFPLVLCTLLSFATGVAVADGPYVSAGAGAALVPGITATPHDLGEAIDAAVNTSGRADDSSAEVKIGVQREGEANWAFDVASSPVARWATISERRA